MKWLFVFPKATRELEPGIIGELRTWCALIPEGRPGAGASSIYNGRMAFQHSEWRLC